jgi:esterase/lipase superfamily enzyme
MAAVDYVITCRRVQHDAFEAKTGPVRFLKVPADAATATPANAVQGAGAIAQWVDEVINLSAAQPNPNSISPEGDILAFVHGYNNDLPAILRRQRQLTANLQAAGWRGLVISFDWPSDDYTLEYWQDRSRASDVSIELVRRCVAIIARGQQAGCKANIHLLGHSTGAYVIMEAFAQAEKEGTLFKSDWRIGQVAFISGDVASASLAAKEGWAQPMFDRIMRLTNYSNGFDAVLGVSNAKRLGVAPRAGRIGLPPDAPLKAINVDCSAYFRDKDASATDHDAGISYTHSWQFGDPVFAADLAMTIEGAMDRNVIPTRRQDNGKLVLQQGARPAFQAVHDTKPPRPVAPH